MTTKVKNILKGLRYISQIFDEKEEEEMQIGYPTDVKHVAHIGWDGPSANTPSWMNKFRSPSEVTSGPLEKLGQLSPKGIQDPKAKSDSLKSRRHHSTNLGSPVSSPTKRGSDSSKHSRRRHSKKDASMESPTRDSSGSSRHSSGSSRHSRRQQKSNLGPQPESSKPDQPAIPKSSRRKKGSTTTEGGSTKSTRSSRSSRSKGQNSLTEIQFSEVETVTKPENEVKNNEGVTENK